MEIAPEPGGVMNTICDKNRNARRSVTPLAILLLSLAVGCGSAADSGSPTGELSRGSDGPDSGTANSGEARAFDGTAGNPAFPAVCGDGLCTGVETCEICAEDCDCTTEYPVSWTDQFNLYPQDEQGWSIIEPSADSLIMYVSSSDGDDATGAAYSPDASEIGDDPFNPTGIVQPFATIAEALDQTREGYPDWVLLKRGDVWVSSGGLRMNEGRSIDERSVLSYYGTAVERPLIRTGPHPGVSLGRRFAAVVGLHFYAHTRDPNSPDYVSSDGSRGLQEYSTAGSPVASILVEDCVFDFYESNSFQGPEPVVDLVIRRSQFLNNYSTTSHSQGIYSHTASILLEENLFDHNGWLNLQEGGGNAQDEGQATMFNHNTYFANSRNTILRRNLFLRPSSIGNKWTANSTGPVDEIKAFNLLTDSNVYVEGEIGVSLGGNEDLGTGPRFRNVHVVDNAFLAIGRTQPTNRTLSMDMWLYDWDTGTVKGNYSLDRNTAAVQNVRPLILRGHMNDVEVSDNVFYGIDSDAICVVIDDDPKSNVQLHHNDFQLGGTEMKLIDMEMAGSVSFADNTYDTGSESSSWLALAGSNIDLAAWASQTGDTSTVETKNYVDPNRTLESYNAALGGEASIDAFVAEARRQSKFNWRIEYTAAAFLTYLRAGFATE